MSNLTLELAGLEPEQQRVVEAANYDFRVLWQAPWEWDAVARVACRNNCGPQGPCSFNAYAKDGIVLRQELAGDYPARNDPDAPDPNPRGCQKALANPHHFAAPSRLKYPLKRAGARGEGKWRRISWDQALDEIAEILIDVLVTDGPGAIIRSSGADGPASATDGLSYTALASALDIPSPDGTAEEGDEEQGVALTFGKGVFGASADNFYYADLLLMWGGNPSATMISCYHYYTAARYNGAKVIQIAPDYNPSSMHADLWVPVRIGTDAALGLAVARILIRDGLFKADFIREQTDLPLLVRADNRKLLREKDLKRGGRDDTFYLWDAAANRLAEAPRKTLALDGMVPALDGEYEVETPSGRITVRPVFEVLKKHLELYTPERASEITGTAPELIERLAAEIGAARAIMWGPHQAWGKFYHGDLIERVILLVLTLGGHVGRKGASPWSLASIAADFAVGGAEQRGAQLLVSAASADPRWAAWREDGYTDEMILYEYAREAYGRGSLFGSSLFFYVHCGLLELSDQHQSWDPYLKSKSGPRSKPGDYLREAFEKGWYTVEPKPGKDPKVLLAIGCDSLRRVRASETVRETLLPKLRLLLSVDWRMTATGMYADYVLPVCSWYEKPNMRFVTPTLHPFQHMMNQVTAPLFESKNEWEMFCLLARKLQERAAARGITTFKDRSGKERRLDNLYDQVTANGLYTEDDLEGLVRDTLLNSTNLEKLDWEDLKERGYVAFTGEGRSARSIGQATDVREGEPVVPLRWHVEGKIPYPTTSRRIQFYIDHDWYLELGEELPTQKEDPKAGGDYALRLSGGHTRWSIQSNHTDDSVLLQLQRGVPVMFMSAADAAARGIRDGETVEVYNDVGAFRIHVAVSAALMPGQVVVHHGWANYQFSGFKHFKNVMPTPLNPVECAGGLYHLRPLATTLYPGHSDRETRIEVRKVV